MADNSADGALIGEADSFPSRGEAFFWSIVDAAPDGIVVVGPDGRIRMVNDQVQELFGYRRRDLIDRHIEDLIPDQFHNAHRDNREAFLADPRVRTMGAGLDLLARRADGSDFPVEVSLSPVRSGGETYVVAAVRDISERVEADRRHREGERALAEAEQALVVADVRERIARDLHDKVIQRIFAAGLTLQSVASTTDGPVGNRLNKVIGELDETIRELRVSIFSLQTVSGGPPAGLRGRVLELITQQSAALGFEPRLGFEGPVDTIGESVADELLATLREALSNVSRHSAANDVRVSVVVAEDVVLTVVDNGIGVPAQTVGGRGVANMTQRAEALGGGCVLSGVETGGTRLEWRVPVRGPD